MTTSAKLKTTPLHALHLALGAKMVPFAGYDMPVQYPAGVLKEHIHTRNQAGLFDVSHMGQLLLCGRDHSRVSGALEALIPGDVLSLVQGQMLYSMLLNRHGGILDDLIVTRTHEDGVLGVVVNAACKVTDVAHLRALLPEDVTLEVLEDRALLALQGPKSAEVLMQLGAGPESLAFMEAGTFDLGGVSCGVTRSGYTGEDGFEISLPSADAPVFAEALLAHTEVEAIGLGARDSLRLEAGLCLYGHDIDESTSPVEAGLRWAIGKRRRADGGFPGEARILQELADGPARRRIGIQPEGRAPAREGAEVVDDAGAVIGKVTSGGFGPTLEGPCSMAIVETAHAATGTRVGLNVRGKINSGVVVRMPFVPHRYHRRAKK